MIRKILAVCVWILSFNAVPALASSRCAVPFIRTLDNQTVQGYMYVVPGARCSIILLRSRGPIFNTRLISQAAHGRVTVENNKIVYVSSPGYLGDDRFTYVKQGLDAVNRPIVRTVEITVKVATKF